MNQMQADLVVLGSGAAGCGAALAGVARGLSVILVEKSERLGGATAASLGGLWVPENHLLSAAGLTDSIEAARRYLHFLSGGYALVPMMEAYLAAAPAALADFAAAGVPFRLLRGLPIPGLYACGNAASPTESGAGYQAGISLMRGLAFGWLAAMDAATASP